MSKQLFTAAILIASTPSVGYAQDGEALPDPLAAGWNGVPVCELLQEDSRLRVLRCTFPPGVGHERHYHAPNFGYTIAGGRVRITDANGVREVNLKAGGNVMGDGVAWHQIMNIGDTTIVYLVVEPK